MMRPIPGSSPLRGRQGRRAIGLVGLVGAWALALQGCASLAGTEHPFKNAPAPEITDIVASPSVMVAPVGGPPPQVGRVLAELVADSLRQRDVLAVTRDPAPGSMLLTGHAEMVPEGRDHALLRVTWSLVRPDGLTTGTFQSEQTIPVLPGKDPYERLSASAMVPFANRAAFRTADLIQNPPKPVQVASNVDASPAADAGTDGKVDAADRDADADADTAAPSKPAKKEKAAAQAKPEDKAKAPRKSDEAAKVVQADTAEKAHRQGTAVEKTEARPTPKPAERPKPETVAQSTSIMTDIREDEADLAPPPLANKAASETPAPKPAEAPVAKPAEPQVKAERPEAAKAAAKPAVAEPPAVKAPIPAKPPAAAPSKSAPPKPTQPAQAKAPPAPERPAPRAVTDLQYASLAAAMSKSEKKRAAREARETQTEAAHGNPAPASANSSAGGVQVASAAASPAGAGLIGTAEALKAGAPAPAANPAAVTQHPVPAQPAAPPKADKPEAPANKAESKATHQPETASRATGAPTPIAATAPATDAARSMPATPASEPPPPPAPKPAAAAPQPPVVGASAVPSPAAPPQTHPTEAKAATPPSAPTRPATPEPAVPSAAPAPSRVAALPPAPAAPRTPITGLIVAPVQGAPGNGNQMLAAAIKQALRGAGLQVADYSQGPQTAVLHGRVSVADAGGEAEDVNIEWTVYDSIGRFLGTVTQHNRLPRSLVEGRWDETAGMAAAGAVAGIQRLVAQPTAAGAS